MAGKGTGGGGPQTKDIGAHILVIEARYYEGIADEMVAGAKAVLDAHGCTFDRIAVPGALEIPQALAAAIEAGRFDPLADDGRPYDGAIAIGCVIRGETFHFEIVCNNSNHWLMEVAAIEGVPVGNAILTVDTQAQAEARAKGGAEGKGGDAARAVLRLIEIRRGFEMAGS
jgi:6,7-dimethyl-8-ribityllumazine synthase